nr:hypothetical protein [Lachnospiraceae bacterium]
FAKDYYFEELVAADPFKEEGNRLKQEQSQAQKAYEEAVKARDAKNAALIQKKELEASYEELLKKKDQLSEKKKEEEMRLAALKRDVEHDQAQLKNSPPTKQLALQEEEAAKKAISKWQKEMDEAKKAHQAMEKSLGEVLGQLQENQQQVASLTEEEERTRKELEGKLESLGYDSLSQIEEVLTVDGRELSSMEDVTKWCGDVEKEVKAYQKKASDVESRLNENLKNTKGLSYVDLSLLLEELQGLQEEKKALDAKSKEEYSALRQTKENIRRLHEGMATLHKLHKIELELKPMVDNTMGRVYKFHEYVLSDFFKQIVEHASHYFMELMDGKYSLEAVIHENKNAKKGEEELRDLDLQAVDEKGNHSNIALLSGGQSFEASLALALGLSEVVQMQKTGKVHIESMFIDEGFGTLDGHRLDQSMMVLNSMTNQNRQIGIITHVEKLVNADTYKKLEVTHKDGLSTVKFVDNK